MCVQTSGSFHNPEFRMCHCSNTANLTWRHRLIGVMIQTHLFRNIYRKCEWCDMTNYEVILIARLIDDLNFHLISESLIPHIIISFFYFYFLKNKNYVFAINLNWCGYKQNNHITKFMAITLWHEYNDTSKILYYRSAITNNILKASEILEFIIRTRSHVSI